MIAIAKPFYFTHHHGQHAIASSVEARSADGKVVRVGFSNSYPGTSDEPCERGLRGGGGFFEPSFDLRHVHSRLLRLAFELLEGDARKRDVIHLSIFAMRVWSAEGRVNRCPV